MYKWKRLAHVAYSLSYVLCFSFAIAITKASGQSFPLLRSNSICSLVHTSEFDCVNRRKKVERFTSLFCYLISFSPPFYSMEFHKNISNSNTWTSSTAKSDGIANCKKHPLQCQFDWHHSKKSFCFGIRKKDKKGESFRHLLNQIAMNRIAFDGVIRTKYEWNNRISYSVIAAPKKCWKMSSNDGDS